MKRGMLVALAFAGLATAAAAAWSSRIGERPQPAPIAAEPWPAWAEKDRIFLTKAQLFQAHAEGAIDRDIQSVLDVRKRMHYGDFVWNDRNVPKGPVWVRVDLAKLFAGRQPDVYIKADDQVLVGTNLIAPYLAALRNAFRFTYGAGFIYDRNFAYSRDVFGGSSN